MEIEVKRSWMGGKNTWKQYAFQLIDSNLKYFSKIDKVKRIPRVYDIIYYSQMDCVNNNNIID